jgi:hypothetical protein
MLPWSSKRLAPAMLVAMHPSRLFVAPLLAVLAGCAAVSTLDGERLTLTSAEFRVYVERVFREQNRVADEIAFALEAADDAPDELAFAEQRLQDACAEVNELATARRDELRLGVRRNLSAARSVPECERTTRAVAELLPSARAR